MEILSLILGLMALLGGLWFWKSRQKSQPPPPPTAPKVAIPSAAAPSVVKKSSLSKALSSWSSLFRQNSKDQTQWESMLISSDMGPKLTNFLIQKMQTSDLDPRSFFKKELFDLLALAEAPDLDQPIQKPFVIFIVGVNGVGKTTTIVKLANFFRAKGSKVGVIGADTFRKAAIDQLERGVYSVGADFFSIKGSEETEGADPSAVIFDGLQKFRDQDVILIDTSGRLHHKKNLMEELKKMKRVSQKVIPDSPHEVWMVIDSTLGQNSVSQGRAFHDALGLTGLILTKLDGLSRGGTIFQLFQELRTPIRFLGIGEAPNDLKAFKTAIFVEELFDPEDLNS